MGLALLIVIGTFCLVGLGEGEELDGIASARLFKFTDRMLVSVDFVAMLVESCLVVLDRADELTQSGFHLGQLAERFLGVHFPEANIITPHRDVAEPMLVI